MVELFVNRLVGQGLRCLQGSKGTISSLRQSNKPAVLRLLDEKNGEYYATLTALHGETATVVIAADTKALDVKEITQPWTGDYLLLWRVPSDYKEKLKPGRGGPPVAWLDRQLALRSGPDSPDRARTGVRRRDRKTGKRISACCRADAGRDRRSEDDNGSDCCSW